MLKKSTIVLFVLVLALIAACGNKPPAALGGNVSSSPSATNSTDSAKKPVVLKLGHIAVTTDPWQKGAEKFAQLVKEKSNGSVEVQIYPSSQLGGDRDVIEGMQSGTVDMGLVAGVLSSFDPTYGILELPYLFRDKTHLEHVLYGPVGDELKTQLLDKSKVRGLSFWMRGPRELTTNKTVASIKDLKGLKIRVPEIPASVDAWKAMGSSPTPMSFNQVYTSLKSGVINAQENPLALIESNKLDEVQKYLIQTNHVFGYVLLAMSDKTYQKLSADQQKAINEAAKEATDFENKLVFDQEDVLLNTLKQKGMQVVQIDTAPLIEAVKPVHQKYADKYGKDIYDKIVNTK
jgi:tripartite ATP-independent transporter DctP family solute receptor